MMGKQSVEYPFCVSHFPSSVDPVDTIGVGFDPSTRMLGWSIVDGSGGLIHTESIKLTTKDDDHEDGIFNKMILISDTVVQHIIHVLNEFEYTNIKFGIEHFTYAYNGTKQKTIVALATINYFLQYLLVKQVSANSVESVYPVTARKKSGVVKEKFDTTDMKELVFHRIMTIYENELDRKLYDTTKKARKDTGIYDAFDSLIIARSLVL